MNKDQDLTYFLNIHQIGQKLKRPCKHQLARSLLLKNGGYLLSHGCAVPSARTGLTSLFGMGRGGTPTL